KKELGVKGGAKVAELRQRILEHVKKQTPSLFTEVATFAAETPSAGDLRDALIQALISAHADGDRGAVTNLVNRLGGTSAPTVAGLAVRAADTGRVLLLRRNANETDPAGETWEFPGGHIEPGEEALDAAKREWSVGKFCHPRHQGTSQITDA